MPGTFVAARRAALLIFLGALGCGSKLEIETRWTAHFDAAVVVEWMDLCGFAVKQERFPPTSAARLYAYAAIALYEGAIVGDPSYNSLAGQLNGLDSLPAPSPPPSPASPYDPATVANRACAVVVRGLAPQMFLPFVTTGPLTIQAINGMEQDWNARRQVAVPADVWQRSFDHGDALGQALLAWANADGWSVVNPAQNTYVPPIGPGLWIPTPPSFLRALQPQWGSLRTFVLVDADEIAVPPPTPFSTDPASPFFAECLEVYTAVNSLTQTQREIAEFWSDDPGLTSTPAGHWVSIVSQLCVRDDLPLQVAAEAYARVGLAVGDAFIACWRVKYLHNLLRPVTFIHEHVDRNWTPALGTPPFPEYTSGHSTQSGAVATVLTDLFGDVAFADFTHASRGFPVRFFASFHHAAAEAAISRLYGGIHFRPAIDVGIDHGRAIGERIVARVAFRN
jgi:hypothetical protein